MQQFITSTKRLVSAQVTTTAQRLLKKLGKFTTKANIKRCIIITYFKTISAWRVETLIPNWQEWQFYTTSIQKASLVSRPVVAFNMHSKHQAQLFIRSFQTDCGLCTHFHLAMDVYGVQKQIKNAPHWELHSELSHMHRNCFCCSFPASILRNASTKLSLPASIHWDGKENGVVTL